MTVPGPRRRVSLALSADYERRTGGWTFADNLARGLRDRGWEVGDLTLPAGFPDPDEAARRGAAAALAALPDGSVVMVDQLCLGVLPEVAAAEGRRLRLVMIVHHPLALELGRPEGERRRLADSERASLAASALALTTSETTAAVLARDYAVPPDRLLAAPPGIDRRPPSRGSGGDAPRLLSVGAVVPRKDHGTLIEALGGLADRPWRLAIVGNRDRAAAHAAALERRAAELGLAERVTLAGELPGPALNALWATADLYVAASTFEGYGSAVAEAVGAGVPVVSTAAGAVPEWLDPRAGLLVPVGDAAAMRDAIGRVLDDPGLHRGLKGGALRAREALPTWADCAARVEAALLPLLATPP